MLTLLRSHRFANAEAAAGTPEAAPAMASSSSRSKGAAAASSTAVAVAIAANRPYPIGAVVRPRSRLTAEALRAALIVEKNAAGAATGDDDGTATAAKKKARKKKKAPSNSLKALLSRAMPHGSAIAEHVAVAAGLDPERDVLDSQGGGGGGGDEEGDGCPPRLSLSDGEVEALLRAAAGVEDWIDRCETVVGETLIAEEEGEGEGGGEGGGGGGGGGSKATVAAEEEKGKGAGKAAVEPPSGYLTVEEGEESASLPEGDDDDARSRSVVYNTFEAFPLAQHEKKEGSGTAAAGEGKGDGEGLGAGKRTPTISFPTFDAAVDEYFSKIARQREAAAARARDAAIAARGERIASDQARRADQLQRDADDARAAAEALEAALCPAEEAIGAVVGALAAGARWDELERTIRAEAAAGNPVAARVASLDLKKNRATLWLPRVAGGGEEAAGGGEEAAGGGEEAAGRGGGGEGGGGGKEAGLSPPPQSLVRVDVDLSLTAHANAAALHQRRRAALLKLDKTRGGHARAAAAAAASADGQRRAAAASAAARDAARAFRPLWFQRFDWFLTSEGYLVLCGRDSVRERERRRGAFFSFIFLIGGVLEKGSLSHVFPFERRAAERSSLSLVFPFKRRAAERRSLSRISFEGSDRGAKRLSIVFLRAKRGSFS